MSKVKNVFVMCEIRRGMNGLPQARILENKMIKIWIAEDGYHPYKFMPGLWKHDEPSLNFCSTVDDFGIHWGKPSIALD